MHNAALLDFFNPRIAAGLALYLLGSCLWVYCLSRAPLSVVYPFNALNFVLVAFLAFAFLDERLSLLSLCGLGFILLGIGCLALAARP